MAVLSNAVTLTVAGASSFITISASPTSFPSSGGTTTVTGATNIPNGTIVTILLNGSPIGTTTVIGGAFTFSFTVAPNPSPTPVTDTVEAQATI